LLVKPQVTTLYTQRDNLVKPSARAQWRPHRALPPAYQLHALPFVSRLQQAVETNFDYQSVARRSVFQKVRAGLSFVRPPGSLIICPEIAARIRSEMRVICRHHLPLSNKLPSQIMGQSWPQIKIAGMGCLGYALSEINTVCALSIAVPQLESDNQ
jgi:hypothetical protein